MNPRLRTRTSVSVGSALLVASTLVLLAASTLVGCNGSNGTGGGSGSAYMNPLSPSPNPTPGPSPDPVVADMTITILGMNGSNSYSPNPATTKVGQTIVWRNGDSIAHTATADGGAFDTGTLAPGATSNLITVAAAGTYGYHCAIHGFVMTGTLIVTP